MRFKPWVLTYPERAGAAASRRIVSRLFLIFSLSLTLCGCFRAYVIRENLAGSEILEPAIIRKPSEEKSLGLLPKYDDFLEGYIAGGLADTQGKPLGGIIVRVTNDIGSELPQFVQGVTDQDGVYKIRFSLPIQWDRLDFTASVAPVSPIWKIAAPQTKFRIYYNRKSGTLAYYPQRIWYCAITESSGGSAGGGAAGKGIFKTNSFLKKKGGNPAAPPGPEKKKKPEDAFGDMNLE